MSLRLQSMNLIVVLVIFNKPDPGTLLMDIDVIVIAKSIYGQSVKKIHLCL
jgi:hypothetical protein